MMDEQQLRKDIQSILHYFQKTSSCGDSKINDNHSFITKNIPRILNLLKSVHTFISSNDVETALENISEMGQFLGQLFVSPVVTSNPSLYQSTLKCIMGLYRTSPVTQLQKHARKWVLALLHSTLCGKASTCSDIPNKHGGVQSLSVPRAHIFKITKKMVETLMQHGGRCRKWSSVSSCHLPVDSSQSLDAVRQLTDILFSCPQIEEFSDLWKELLSLLYSYDNNSTTVKAIYSQLTQQSKGYHLGVEGLCLLWKSYPPCLEQDFLHMCEEALQWTLSSNIRKSILNHRVVDVCTHKPDMMFIVHNMFDHLLQHADDERKIPILSVQKEFFYLVHTKSKGFDFLQDPSVGLLQSPVFDSLNIWMSQSVSNLKTEQRCKYIVKICKVINIIRYDMKPNQEEFRRETARFSICHGYWLNLVLQLVFSCSLKYVRNCVELLIFLTPGKKSVEPRTEMTTVEEIVTDLNKLMKITSVQRRDMDEFIAKIGAIYDRDIQNLMRQLLMTFLVQHPNGIQLLTHILPQVIGSNCLHRQLLCLLQTFEAFEMDLPHFDDERLLCYKNVISDLKNRTQSSEQTMGVGEKESYFNHKEILSASEHFVAQINNVICKNDISCS